MLDRREQPQRLGLESEPLVGGACVAVRHLDAESQHRRVLLVAQPHRRLADQLARCPLPARVGHDVEIAQVADARVVDLRQREPDDLPRIVLGNERDVLVAEVILELTELVLDVDRDARRRRDLSHELPVEVAQAVAVLRCCLANRHTGGAVR